MFWNSRMQNMMSAAFAGASSACAPSANDAYTALTVDAMLLASILVILGVLVCLSLALGIITVGVLVLLVLAEKLNRRGKRWKTCKA